MFEIMFESWIKAKTAAAVDASISHKAMHINCGIALKEFECFIHCYIVI